MSLFSEASKLTNYLRDNFDWQVQEVNLCRVAYYSTRSCLSILALLHMCNPFLPDTKHFQQLPYSKHLGNALRCSRRSVTCRNSPDGSFRSFTRKSLRLVSFVPCCPVCNPSLSWSSTMCCICSTHSPSFFQGFWTGGWACISWLVTHGLGHFYNWWEFYVGHAILESTCYHLSGKLHLLCWLYSTVFNPLIP